MSCPISHFPKLQPMRPAVKEQTRSSLSRLPKTSSPPELHLGPSCSPSEARCFSSLVHIPCLSLAAGVCLSVPGCTYPANAIQTLTHSPYLSHHHRSLLLHIPAFPSPGCAQPVQLLFTTDTTHHQALWLQAHAGSLFCLLGTRKQDNKAHTDTCAFCCILPHALPDDHLQQ